MSILDQFNQMMIEEAIQGMLVHIDDKDMIKEKASEITQHFDKLPDDQVIMLTKINGRINATICGQTKLAGWNGKPPDFIDVESIIDKVLNSLDD